MGHFEDADELIRSCNEFVARSRELSVCADTPVM